MSNAEKTRKKHPVRNTILIIFAGVMLVFVWNFLVPRDLKYVEGKLGKKPMLFDLFEKSGEEYKDYGLYQIQKQDLKYYSDPYYVTSGITLINLYGYPCQYSYRLNEDGEIQNVYLTYEGDDRSKRLELMELLEKEVQKLYGNDNLIPFTYEEGKDGMSLIEAVKLDTLAFPCSFATDKYNGQVGEIADWRVSYSIDFLDDWIREDLTK